MNITDISGKFDLIQEVILAASDSERAYVRPVMLFYYKGRFFVATGSTDAKSQQISRTVKSEICYYPDKEEKGCYIRINGKAELVSDIVLKGEIMEVADFIKNYWTDPADKGYTFIELQPDWFEYMPYKSNLEVRIEKES